jgi:hypothetical protein
LRSLGPPHLGPGSRAPRGRVARARARDALCDSCLAAPLQKRCQRKTGWFTRRACQCANWLLAPRAQAAPRGPGANGTKCASRARTSRSAWRTVCVSPAVLQAAAGRKAALPCRHGASQSVAGAVAPPGIGFAENRLDRPNSFRYQPAPRVFDWLSITPCCTLQRLPPCHAPWPPARGCPAGLAWFAPRSFGRLHDHGGVGTATWHRLHTTRWHRQHPSRFAASG